MTLNSFLDVWVILRQVHRTVFDGDLLRTPQYVVVTVAYLLVYAAYGIPYLFLPHKASEVGLSEDLVSLLVSIIGISNLTARFLMAIVASSSIRNRMFLLSLSFAAHTLSLLTFPFFSDFLYLALGAGLFGFSSGKLRKNGYDIKNVCFIYLQYFSSKYIFWGNNRNFHQYNARCAA